jgi:hypothetical protein
MSHSQRASNQGQFAEDFRPVTHTRQRGWFDGAGPSSGLDAKGGRDISKRWLALLRRLVVAIEGSKTTSPAAEGKLERQAVVGEFHGRGLVLEVDDAGGVPVGPAFHAREPCQEPALAHAAGVGRLAATGDADAGAGWNALYQLDHNAMGSLKTRCPPLASRRQRREQSKPRHRRKTMIVRIPDAGCHDA